MIRPIIFKKVNETIELEDFFSQHDFEITAIGDSENILSIKYRYDEKYFFNAQIPSEKFTKKTDYGPTEIYNIRTSLSPGEMGSHEQVNFEGLSDMLRGIKEWLSWLKDDIIAAPLNRKVTEFEKEVTHLSSKLDEIEDGYFTVEEAKDYKKKLDEMYEVFESTLREEMTNKKKLDEELVKIKKEIQTLKLTIESLKKKQWFKSVIVRFVNWSQNPTNRKLLAAGGKLVKGLLPEVIPDTPEE